MREFFEETIVELLDLGGGAFAGAVDTGAFDVATDDVAHFTGIERFADVIVGPETQRFLGRLQRTEAGQHDDGQMWIDLADLAQAFDAVHPWHANVHDDGVGLFFPEQLKSGLDAIGGVHLIIGFEEHAKAFPRPNLVVDDKNLGQFGQGGHNRPKQLAARRVPRAGKEPNNFRLIAEAWARNVEVEKVGAQAANCE